MHIEKIKHNYYIKFKEHLHIDHYIKINFIVFYINIFLWLFHSKKKVHKLAYFSMLAPHQLSDTIALICSSRESYAFHIGRPHLFSYKEW